MSLSVFVLSGSYITAVGIDTIEFVQMRTKIWPRLCFILSLLLFYTHNTRTNSVFYLHHCYNASNHSIALDSDGLPVTRQHPAHQTKVE